jgi:hypothetical protein
MYLVELRPGKEELYRTGDELASAIRSGDVDIHSRIYHRATSKWISITLHPQFKSITTAPAEPLPPLERANWTFFNDSADTLEGANDPSVESGPAEPVEPEGPAPTDPNHPWRRPMALSVTGILLILGIQLASAGPKPPWAVREASAASSGELRTAALRAASPRPPTVSFASRRDDWNRDDDALVSEQPDGSADLHPATSGPAPVTPAAAVLPAAPRISRMKSILSEAVQPSPAAATNERTVDGLLARWGAAHESARARLESGIRVARLGQLFAPGRLSAGGGVTETRLNLAGMANFIRVFRQQQASVEQAYQDSFLVASRQLHWSPQAVRAWYAKSSPVEEPALVALTSSLVDRIDSLLGVLDAQAGTYTLTKNAIRFEDAGAAREYSALRQRITATVDSAKAAHGAESQGPMGYLLRAIGTTRLPLGL